MDRRNTESGKTKKVTIKRVTELTGMNAQTIRYGLDHGELPIGCAIKTGEMRTYYHIVPERLATYLGISVEEVLGEVISERGVN